MNFPKLGVIRCKFCQIWVKICFFQPKIDKILKCARIASKYLCNYVNMYFVGFVWKGVFFFTCFLMSLCLCTCSVFSFLLLFVLYFLSFCFHFNVIFTLTATKYMHTWIQINKLSFRYELIFTSPRCLVVVYDSIYKLFLSPLTKPQLYLRINMTLVYTTAPNSSYFLIPYRNPAEMSRRSILFHNFIKHV